MPYDTRNEHFCMDGMLAVATRMYTNKMFTVLMCVLYGAMQQLAVLLFTLLRSASILVVTQSVNQNSAT